MKELQIVSLENTDIVGWDFEQIKSPARRGNFFTPVFCGKNANCI